MRLVCRVLCVICFLCLCLCVGVRHACVRYVFVRCVMRVVLECCALCFVLVCCVLCDVFAVVVAYVFTCARFCLCVLYLCVAC